MSAYNEKGKYVLTVYAFIFLFLVMGIITGGILSYRDFELGFRRQAEKQISAIAELKVNGLVNWRSERLSDARFFYQNPAFSSLVEDYFENPGDASLRAEIAIGMEHYQSHVQYDQISLLDAEGKSWLAVPDSLEEPSPNYSNLKRDIAASLDSGEVMFLDFQRDPAMGDRIYIPILVPIFSEKDQHPLGVLAIRIDPETYLYPYINQWPIPSDTAETLLVRRDGDDVLFLNKLRFAQDSALNLRYSLTETNIPAVKAVLGQTGLVEGTDYHGQFVLADVRQIPNSPWFLVSKANAEEVYAPLRERLWQTLLIVGMAIFISGLALFAIWRQQRILFYRSKAETAEKLREAQLVLESSPVILFRWKAAEGWPVELVSENVAQFGYKVEDLLSGMVPYASIIHPDDLERVHREVKEYSDSGVDRFQQEYRILTRDGQVRWTDDRTVIERGAEGNIMHFQGTVTDVTERKKAEEELDRQTALFRNLFERSPEALTIVDQEDRILNVNRSFETLFGYREAEIQGQYVNDLIVSEPYLDEAESITQTSLGVGQVVEKETVRCTKDGRLVDVSMVGYPIVVEGRIIGGSAIYRDITERKNMERSLRERERQYRTLVEQIPAIVYIDDVSDNIHTIYIGPQIEKILGYSPREWLKEMPGIWETCVHPDDRELISSRFMRCAENGEPFEAEYRIWSADGRLVWVHDQAVLLRDENGNPQLIHGVMQDITERKQAEEALRVAEEKYRQIFENVMEGVTQTTPEGKYITANPSAARIIGYDSPEEMIANRSDLDHQFYVKPGRRDEFKKLMEEYGVITGFESEVYRINGDRIWISENSRAVRDAHGNLLYYEGTSQDITERKQAEEALRVAEEKYRQIFENVMEGITQTTPEGRYITANPSAAQIIGYDSPKEMIASRTDLDRQFYVKPGRRDEFKKLMEETDSVSGFESEVYRNDGGTIWILENSRAVRDEHGNLLYYEGTALDITDRKRAEDEIKRNANFTNTLLDAIPTPVFYKDREGRYQGCNRAFTEVMGVTSIEMQGRTVHDLWPSEYADVYHRKDVELMGNPQHQSYEFQVRDKNGAVRPVIYAKDVFRDEHGQVAGMVGAFIDITDRKRAEQALRDSQQLLQAVMDNIPQCIFWKDSGLTYLGCNRAFAESVGLTSPGDIVGKTDWDLPSEHAELYRADDRRVMESGIPKLNYEEPQTKPDGTVTWLRTSKVPMRDVDGNVYAVLGMYEDITDRKRTEEALKESEAIFSSFLEHSPVYVFFKDREIRSLMLSKNYEQMLGMPISDLLGKTMDDLFPSDLAKSMVADDLQILNEGRRITVVEELNGRVYETTKFPVLKDGEPYILAGFTLDITERKRAEEALRESEERLRLAVLAGRMGTWDRNFLSGQLDWSVECKAMFGLSPEVEMNDERFIHALHPEDRLSTDLAIREALEKQTDFNTEYRVIWPDGTIHWIAAQGRGYYNEAGQAIHMLGVTSDITTRKRAEKALLESEERLRTYYDNATIGLYRTTPDGRILMLNPAGVRMMGFDSFDEISRRNLEDAEFESSRREFREKIERDGVVIGLESKWIKKDGSMIFVRESAKAMRDGNGKSLYYDGSFEDVTERVRAEEALRESERRYKLVSELTSDYIYKVGIAPDGKASLDFVTDSFYGITQRSKEEAQTIEAWNKIVHPDDLNDFWSFFQQLLITRQPGRLECRAFIGSGQMRWVEAMARPEWDEQEGRVTSIVGAVKDITARKQAEQEIRKLNVELEQRVRERTAQLETTNKELEAFSYSVSHDLRAPLRGIDGWSQALFEDYHEKLDEQGKQYIDRVRSETQRMGHLIDDMLQLSRLTRAEINREEVDLSALAQVIVERLKQEEPHRRVEVNIHAGMIADCDSNLLEAVLSNLLENAFKFTSKREDARIEFGQTELEDQHVFFVRDNGAGFDMAYAQKLFGAFQRMHKASEFPGTGVGLATVQRIIHRHGGRVWSEAEPGRGAVFYFTLD